MERKLVENIASFNKKKPQIEKFIETLLLFYFGQDFLKFLNKEYQEQLYAAINRGYEEIKYLNALQNSKFKRKQDKYESEYAKNFLKIVYSNTMVEQITTLLPSPNYKLTNKQTKKFYEKILGDFIDELLK